MLVAGGNHGGEYHDQPGRERWVWGLMRGLSAGRLTKNLGVLRSGAAQEFLIRISRHGSVLPPDTDDRGCSL